MNKHFSVAKVKVADHSPRPKTNKCVQNNIQVISFFRASPPVNHAFRNDRSTSTNPTARTAFARKHSWALAALVLLTVLLGADSKLLNGRAAPLWDANDLFAPYFTLIADHARVGKYFLGAFDRAGAHRHPPSLSSPPCPLSQLLSEPSRGGSEAGFRAYYWLLIWLLGPLGEPAHRTTSLIYNDFSR